MNDLRKLIAQRVNDRDDRINNKLYCAAINKQINNVYAKRFGAFTENKKELIIDSEKPDIHNFFSDCWSRLESELDNNLAKYSDTMLDCTTAPDDRSIKRYLETMFERILQKMINQQNPEFATRKGQIRRIMRSSDAIHIDKEGKRRKDKICRLNGLSSEVRPTNEETLKNIFESITNIPERIFPKKTDTKRGSSILDKDMEAFLTEILHRAGGAVRYNDLLGEIKELYSPKSPEGNPPESTNETTQDNFNKDDDDIEEHDFNKTKNQSDTLYSIAHQKVANAIVDNFDDRLKSIYYHYHIDDKRLNEVGEILNLSTATISNNNKKLEIIFKKHQKINDFSIDEMKAILKIVSEKIYQSEK